MTDSIRMFPGIELRADESGDGHTLAGYAAVFNSPTEIKSWEGHFMETLAPGAFKRTLQNNGDRIKVLFNHGMDPSIGNKPLGKPSVMREDAQGLWVEVPLSATSYNADIRALVEDGAIDGWSFRFSVPKGGDVWKNPTERGGLRERTVTEAKVPELGPVTFPAYTATTMGLRSREEFSIWRALPDDKRAALFDILGTSSDEEPAASATDSEPLATTPAHLTQSGVRARLLNHGVDQWLESTTSARS